MQRVNKPIAFFREQISNCAVYVDQILGEKPTDNKPRRPTVFHHLRDHPDLPPEEKSRPRLVEEAMSVIGAGTLTSAFVLGSTTYRVLANNGILERLMSELENANPQDPSSIPLQDLEKLPYLTAVIHEGLRLGYGLSHRLQRIHELPLQFQSWTIPPGTPTSMSPFFLHEDPEMFPDPREFRPERWLNTTQHDAMERRLFSFGIGSRQCVGINLAYAELYLALSTVFGSFGRRINLFDTERVRDIDVTHDYFLSAASHDSRGVHIKLKM